MPTCSTAKKSQMNLAHLMSGMQVDEVSAAFNL